MKIELTLITSDCQIYVHVWKNNREKLKALIWCPYLLFLLPKTLGYRSSHKTTSTPMMHEHARSVTAMAADRWPTRPAKHAKHPASTPSIQYILLATGTRRSTSTLLGTILQRGNFNDKKKKDDASKRPTKYLRTAGLTGDTDWRPSYFQGKDSFVYAAPGASSMTLPVLLLSPYDVLVAGWKHPPSSNYFGRYFQTPRWSIINRELRVTHFCICDSNPKWVWCHDRGVYTIYSHFHDVPPWSGAIFKPQARWFRNRESAILVLHCCTYNINTYLTLIPSDLPPKRESGPTFKGLILRFFSLDFFCTKPSTKKVFF